MKGNESAFSIYCGSGIIIAHDVSKHTLKNLSPYYENACFRHCYQLKWGSLCYFKPYLPGWWSDTQCIRGSRNPGDSSDPVYIVTLLQQRQERLTQAGPIRVSLIETWNLEWIPEENGSCRSWVTLVAVLQAERPWQILRYQTALDSPILLFSISFDSLRHLQHPSNKFPLLLKLNKVHFRCL